MKNNKGHAYRQAGIAPLIAILIVVGILALAGGGYYAVKKYTSPAVQPVVNQNQTPTQPAQDETAGWKTYTDSQRGYTINYPADAKFSLNDYIVKSCAQIYTKEFGVVYIGGCGEPTGFGVGMVFVKDSVTIDGRQYSAYGRRESDNSYSFLSFGFTSNGKISISSITYGVDHSDIGPLTDAEYQAALNSAKEIVSTIKLTQ